MASPRSSPKASTTPETSPIALLRPVMAPYGTVRGHAGVSLDGEKVRLRVTDTSPIADALERIPAADMVCDVDDCGEPIFKSLVISNSGALVGSNSGGFDILVIDYDLAVAALGAGDFLKSDHGPIPAGARWITVHPNGPGSKGTPVLVQPVKDGSGHMRVIGGAGGKLNMLKLRGVKSPEHYRAAHAERAAAKRAMIKERTRQDKELGVHHAKVEARKQLKADKLKAEKDFVSNVAEAMGGPDGPSRHARTA